jgi:ectoine hydroxylase-related dioxygenase (phytanoyl-CoA dioxygenase family)
MIPAAKLRQYDAQGYTICERVLSGDALDDMTAYIDQYVHHQSKSRRPEHLDKPHLEDARFLEFCSHASLLDVVEDFIGPNIVLFSSHLICKAKGDGLAVPWHQDAYFWPLEPMNVVTLWLAIDDSTVENGCMRVVPGTHKQGPIEHVEAPDPQTKVLHMGIPPEQVDESRAADVCIPRGGASFHAPYLVHGSNPNKSDKRRCGFTMRFMPAETKLTRTGPLSKWFAEHKLFLLRGRDDKGVNSYANQPAMS